MFHANNKVAVSQLIFSFAIALVASSSAAENWSFESIGFRAGTSLNDRSETFRQAEVVGTLNLPWHWQPARDWRIDTRLEFSAGWLRGEGEDAALGTAGPSAILSWKNFPVKLDLGSSPTLISRYQFGNRDFGMLFQFTSHAGLNWEISRHFSLGYRYSHMSNAGLAKSNPGLNLHLLGVSYRF